MLVVVESGTYSISGIKTLDVLIDRAAERQLTIGVAKTLDTIDAGSDAEVWEAIELKAPLSAASSDDRMVVERRFSQPISPQELRDRESRGEWCLELHNVIFIGSFCSIDRKRMVCLYRAADLESLRIAQRTIGLPVDRIWAEGNVDSSMVRKSSDKLWVSDTTLRDGLTDIQIRAEEKLRLLRLIDGIGVDSIEVGMTTADSTSDDALDDALGCVKRAVATVLAHPNPNAIARAGRALMSAVRPRLSVYNAVSDRTSIDSRGLMTELGKQRLEQIRSTVTISLEHCADVQWSALDATRAEPLFLCRAMETAIEAGATTVTISDTRGQALPEEIEALLNTMHQHVSGLASVRVSVHFHNDLGLATANVLAALQMGVRQVEGTLGGIGPHGGNTALEEVVSAVRQREDRFTLDSGMNLDAVGLIVSAVRAAGHK